jgi:hypothetical protein
VSVRLFIVLIDSIQLPTSMGRYQCRLLW